MKRLGKRPFIPKKTPTAFMLIVEKSQKSLNKGWRQPFTTMAYVDSDLVTVSFDGNQYHFTVSDGRSGSNSDRVQFNKELLRALTQKPLKRTKRAV